MATIEELEKKREERRANHDKARDEQILIDLAAIDALEEAGGEPLHTMTANRFKAGQPYKIAFRAPSPVEYKRYNDMVSRALQQKDQAARIKAQELLASAVLLYPAEAERAAFLEAFPGLLMSICGEAAKVVELRNEEEGKG